MRSVEPNTHARFFRHGGVGRAAIVIVLVFAALITTVITLMHRAHERWLDRQVAELLSTDPSVQDAAMSRWLAMPRGMPAMIELENGRIDDRVRIEIGEADSGAARRLVSVVRSIGGGCDVSYGWAAPWSTLDAELLVGGLVTDAAPLLGVIDDDLGCGLKWFREHDSIRCIEALLKHPDPRVRLAGLRRAPLALEPDHVEPAIALVMDDPDPAVRRFAWLMMAWLNPVRGYTGDWSSAPTQVGEAMIAAAVLTSDDPEAALAHVVSRLDEAGESERFAPAIALLAAMAPARGAPPIACYPARDYPRWSRDDNAGLRQLVGQLAGELAGEHDDGRAIAAHVPAGAADAFNDQAVRDLASALTRAWLLTHDVRNAPEPGSAP